MPSERANIKEWRYRVRDIILDKVNKVLHDDWRPVGSIANETGFRVGLINSWKRREFCPSVIQLAKLGQVVGVPLNVFLDDNEELLGRHNYDPQMIASQSPENTVYNLRILCFMLGMKCSQISREIGVNTHLVERLHRGHLPRNPDVYLALAKTYGLTVLEIFQDMTKTPRVHGFFEKLPPGGRIRFMLALKRVPFLEACELSNFDPQKVDIPFYTSFDTAMFASWMHVYFQVPLDWFFKADGNYELHLPVGMSLRTNWNTVI